MKVYYNFVIIGTGGTGGNFIKEFARFVSCLCEKQRQRIQITLVDGDIVEDKNRSRQPFIKDDINQGKAFVLAEAIEDNFGLTVHVSESYITKVEQLKNIVSAADNYFFDNSYHSKHIPVIIGCVDNHRARQVMEEYFQIQNNCIYLDSANEFSVGEVVCGSKIQGKEVSPSRIFYYPEILDDKSPNKIEESCQQINISTPQHLVTNIMASSIMLKECVELVMKDTVPTGIIYFDAFKCFMKKRNLSTKEEANDCL